MTTQPRVGTLAKAVYAGGNRQSVFGYSTVLPADVLEALRRLAAEHNRDLTGEVRHALRRYVDDHRLPQGDTMAKAGPNNPGPLDGGYGASGEVSNTEFPESPGAEDEASMAETAPHIGNQQAPAENEAV